VLEVDHYRRSGLLISWQWLGMMKRVARTNTTVTSTNGQFASRSLL
jgi:hypothetical protein